MVKTHIKAMMVYILVVVVLLLLLGVSSCEHIGVTGEEGGINPYQFDAKIISAKFDTATRTLSTMFDPSIRLSVPIGGLPIIVSVIPKDSFTGEPFRFVVINGEEKIISSVPVWVVLKDKRDGYCLDIVGCFTWSLEELQPPDETIRNYDYLEAMKNQRKKKVTFRVDGSDKAVVLLKEEIEAYLTKHRDKAWSDLFSGEAFDKSGADVEAEIAELNEGALAIVNKYFKVEVVGEKQFLEYAME